MTPLHRILIPALFVGLLAIAPIAEAQVAHGHIDHPPTQAQIDQQRTDLQQRIDRLDRDFTTFERAAPAVRDAQRRTTAEQDVARIRQQRDAVRQEWTRLQEATPQNWAERHRAFTQRFDEYEHGLHRARLAVAGTPAEYRGMAAQRLEANRARLAEYHRHLQHMDADRRAQAAHRLIQLRRQHDDLHRRQLRMARVSPAEFPNVQRTFMDDWTRFDTQVRTVGRDHIYVHGPAAAR